VTSPLELDEFASYGLGWAGAIRTAARAPAITAALKMAMLRTRMKNPPVSGRLCGRSPQRLQ